MQLFGAIFLQLFAELALPQFERDHFLLRRFHKAFTRRLDQMLVHYVLRLLSQQVQALEHGRNTGSLMQRNQEIRSLMFLKTQVVGGENKPMASAAAASCRLDGCLWRNINVIETSSDYHMLWAALPLAWPH